MHSGQCTIVTSLQAVLERFLVLFSSPVFTVFLTLCVMYQVEKKKKTACDSHISPLSNVVMPHSLFLMPSDPEQEKKTKKTYEESSNIVWTSFTFLQNKSPQGGSGLSSLVLCLAIGHTAPCTMDLPAILVCTHTHKNCAHNSPMSHA